MKHSPSRLKFLLKPIGWFGSHRLTVRISYGAGIAAAALICLSAVFIFNADSIKLGHFSKNIDVPLPAQKYYSPLTGIEISGPKNVNQAATAIMIENSPRARPQSGLKESGVVFEAIAEGGITRFLVVYQHKKPELIGPVRSLRSYYVDWLAPFNASVAHVGGSAAALREIRNGKYRDIDQFFNSQAYWRATDRYAPHNVYTNFDRLNTLNKAKGYTKSSVKGFARQDGEVAESPNAKNINVNISNPTYNSSYTYASASNKYKRFQGGAPHNDREKGQISPSVVVVLKVNETTVMEDGWRQSIQTIGSGAAVIFQNGVAQEVTWNKSSRTSQIKFTDKKGEVVPFNRGQTWITAVPNDSGSVTWN